MKVYPPSLLIPPVSRACGTVVLPGSKSISNRVLLLAALSSSVCRLSGVLEAEDTDRMKEALSTLGVDVRRDPSDASSYMVRGCSGRFPVRTARLFLGNAGTAMRTLCAALALFGGDYILDGVERMRQRPIGPLVDALRALGADVHCLQGSGCPPVQIGPMAGIGPRCSITGSVSSQFISALLMAGQVYAGPSGLVIDIDGPLISRPYVEMTLRLMKRFGAEVEDRGNSFFVPGGAYRLGAPLRVEGDASGASYFLALGALAGGPVRVEGAGSASIQGDVEFARVLERMGARISWGPDWIEARAPESGKLRGIEVDCTAIPDAAMTLAAVALKAEGPTKLTGIGSWRVKETDRIAALQTELRSVGAKVASGEDWLTVEPTQALRAADVRTYGDHRIAMTMSLAACAGVPVRILEPGCVAKTYPTYFDEFAAVTGCEF
ncbi:3-phosphoshikimate 1-carboxyvinyltransferase [Mesosutterella sp. OilRF-GAM-744-9]|uniref:3-phosphoshikimate 1-carboxyvinyltransferase n=1 Tax=Mesosutterella porci TaxID=2915351 RepID=A0ABS9MSW1_9BURK|nr:3-phosphoshikimate 1-carboxyvinyltransferase [Mesosutterella sp. oilRF-744-WT-GAM-9]MCG5031622.1 3-phosphoshikimate 1-carboxyvinyltransferase [Mesosutterella sp. oilRF-744-WT-GAM-9]